MKNRADSEMAQIPLREAIRDFDPAKIDLKDFPMHFRTLRKLNGQFVLYDRCNASDFTYVLRDTAFISYRPHDLIAVPIDSIISFTDARLVLRLNGSLYYDDPEYMLTIEKTEFEYVYKMTQGIEERNYWVFVTPAEQVGNFDIVVNHCPEDMMMEFSGFDKVEK